MPRVKRLQPLNGGWSDSGRAPARSARGNPEQTGWDGAESWALPGSALVTCINSLLATLRLTQPSSCLRPPRSPRAARSWHLPTFRCARISRDLANHPPRSAGSAGLERDGWEQTPEGPADVLRDPGWRLAPVCSRSDWPLGRAEPQSGGI